LPWGWGWVAAFGGMTAAMPWVWDRLRGRADRQVSIRESREGRRETSTEPH
jgi:hypothetical protein